MNVQADAGERKSKNNHTAKEAAEQTGGLMVINGRQDVELS